MSGLFNVAKGLTKREILAFKAGGWASIPMDYVIENYGIPYAKKHFGEKAFYAHISKMPKRKRGGRRRRKLTAEPMLISQESLKRAGPELLRAAKRAKYSPTMVRSIPEKKCFYQEIPQNLQSVGVLRVDQLLTVPQGAESGQRIGQKIRAHYIDVRGWLRNESTSLGQTVRIVFVQDNKPQLGTLTTNLFQTESSDNDPVNFVGTGDLSQVTKKINTSRFRVISDRRFKLAPRVTSNDTKTYVNLNYKVNINRNIDYLTDLGLETDVNRITPNIYCLVFFELESSTTGANLLDKHIQFYQYFSG